MKVKNIFSILTVVLLIAISLPASSSTVVPDPATSGPLPRTQQLIQRLEYIRDMDKSELTRSEKKDLRREVKDLRKEVRKNTGVYLSVGAIIIIILLLILIL
ncbi:MAG: hypothetical protein ABIR18_07990 [Chitinophagaceae bacterium]